MSADAFLNKLYEYMKIMETKSLYSFKLYIKNAYRSAKEKSDVKMEKKRATNKYVCDRLPCH